MILQNGLDKLKRNARCNNLRIPLCYFLQIDGESVLKGELPIPYKRRYTISYRPGQESAALS